MHPYLLTGAHGVEGVSRQVLSDKVGAKVEEEFGCKAVGVQSGLKTVCDIPRTPIGQAWPARDDWSPQNSFRPKVPSVEWLDGWLGGVEWILAQPTCRSANVYCESEGACTAALREMEDPMAEVPPVYLSDLSLTGLLPESAEVRPLVHSRSVLPERKQLVRENSEETPHIEGPVSPLPAPGLPLTGAEGLSVEQRTSPLVGTAQATEVVPSASSRPNEEAPASSQQPSAKDWICHMCTFVNNDAGLACEMCATPRKAIADVPAAPIPAARGGPLAGIAETARQDVDEPLVDLDEVLGLAQRPALLGYGAAAFKLTGHWDKPQAAATPSGPSSFVSAPGSSLAQGVCNDAIEKLQTQVESGVRALQNAHPATLENSIRPPEEFESGRSARDERFAAALAATAPAGRPSIMTQDVRPPAPTGLSMKPESWNQTVAPVISQEIARKLSQDSQTSTFKTGLNAAARAAAARQQEAAAEQAAVSSSGKPIRGMAASQGAAEQAAVSPSGETTKIKAPVVSLPSAPSSSVPPSGSTASGMSKSYFGTLKKKTKAVIDQTPKSAIIPNDARVQILLDDGWRDCSADDTKQIRSSLAGGQTRFGISARGAMYIIELSADGLKQKNAASGKSRDLRLMDKKTGCPLPLPPVPT